MREDLTWLLGEEWYTEKIESGFETQKRHTIKAYWWFKGDLISQWIPKFYLCDESNPINPQCGKISANFYISPPHPPHPQFYPQKWWKFRYSSWLTKIISHLNRPAWCAGQLRQPKLRPIEALSGFGGEYRSRKEGRNFDCSDSWRILPDSRVPVQRPHDLPRSIQATHQHNPTLFSESIRI